MRVFSMTPEQRARADASFTDVLVELGRREGILVEQFDKGNLCVWTASIAECGRFSRANEWPVENLKAARNAVQLVSKKFEKKPPVLLLDHRHGYAKVLVVAWLDVRVAPPPTSRIAAALR